MIYCPNCGTQNGDDTQYCQNCGTPLHAAAQQPVGGYAAPMQQQPVQAPVQMPVQAPYPPSRPTRPLPSNPVHALLFKQVSGGLFLTGAIAYAVSLLFKLMAAFTVGSTLRYVTMLLSNLMPYSSYDSDYAALFDFIDMFSGTMSVSAVFIAIISMTPGILIAISMWLIFFAVRNSYNTRIGTTGLTIIKVITIIQLVFVSLIFLIGEVLLCIITYNFSQDSYYSSDSVTTVLIIAIVVLAIVAALAIVYFLKLISSLSTMRNTALTLCPSDDISTYIAVITFVLAFFLLFSIPFSGGVFGAMSVIAAIVADITFGIFLLSYKKNMRIMMSGGMPSILQQAAYQAAQQPPMQAPAFQQPPMVAPQPAPYAPIPNEPQVVTPTIPNSDNSSVNDSDINV